MSSRFTLRSKLGALFMVGLVVGCAPAPKPRVHTVVIVGNSLVANDTAQVKYAVEADGRWRVVQIDGVPGASTWDHPGLPKQLARTDVDAIVLVFGENETDKTRSIAGFASVVLRSWEYVDAAAKERCVVWRTQQTAYETWANNPWGRLTSAVARQFNTWQYQHGPVAPWGIWADTNHTRQHHSWFPNFYATPPDHVHPGLAGHIALGQTIRIGLDGC